MSIEFHNTILFCIIVSLMTAGCCASKCQSKIETISIENVFIQKIVAGEADKPEQWKISFTSNNIIFTHAYFQNYSGKLFTTNKSTTGDLTLSTHSSPKQITELLKSHKIIVSTLHGSKEIFYIVKDFEELTPLYLPESNKVDE